MAKSFVGLTSTVNELATQIVLPSISEKELNSTKDTHLATSQGDDSTSEPDNKSKDDSTDPSHNRGDETDPKVLAHPKWSWSISSKGCQLPGVDPKDVCGVITSVKRNGQFINITWTTLMLTHRIVFMIQVKEVMCSTSSSW